jgi:hypothetical protein
MIWLKRIVFVLPCVILGLTGCGSSFSNPELSVSPSSIAVAAGSTTTFTAVFAHAVAAGGSLTWSVTPANAGTITGGGVYTASATAGRYAIVATWTPSNPATATIVKGSTTVEIRAVPQLDSVISPDQVQASGGNQANATIQNGLIVGQEVPSVLSMDPGGNIQVRSGYAVPIPCAVANTMCR